MIKKELPKYLKIKDFIIGGIRNRSFTHAIPSENQLSEKFGVSRMTARKALDALEREGLVVRIPGKGTFIKKQHYTTGFFRVRPFQKWADDLNVDLTSQVLEASLLDPQTEISTLLQYDEDVIFFRRLWYFDDKPVRYEIRYIRPDICAGILWENLENKSIHDILINQYNVPLTKIKQSVVAVGLTKKDALLFKEKQGYPAFHFQRLAFSDEIPVTYVEYYMRGEMAFRDTFSPQFDPSDFSDLPGSIIHPKDR